MRDTQHASIQRALERSPDAEKGGSPAIKLDRVDQLWRSLRATTDGRDEAPEPDHRDEKGQADRLQHADPVALRECPCS